MTNKKTIAREVKIIDAVLKEDEDSDEQSEVSQYIWLQLQDLETNRYYTSALSLNNIRSIMDNEKVIKCPNCKKELTQQQVNEIASLSRDSLQNLEGRKLIDFCTKLKMREDPLILKFDPAADEITPDMIMNEEGI